MPQACYQRSLFKSLYWFTLDLTLFLLGMGIIFFSENVSFKLMGGVLCGLASVSMFIWAHDAAHGTLFKSNRVAEVLGTIMMLPSLSIYRMWVIGHNKIHHGFTAYSPFDWIWRPLTPNQYLALKTHERLLYKIERHFLTCGFHYLRRIWWQGMVLVNPGKSKQQKQFYRFGKMLCLIYVILSTTLSFIYAGGFIGILAFVFTPFIIFTYSIAMIVYLHHTHPEIPFFNQKEDWSHAIGAIYCSTIIHNSKLSSLFLHNIYLHIPHHIDFRIPFYNLKQATDALRIKYGAYFHESNFKWQTVWMIFARCQLYDFEKQKWLRFDDIHQKTR